MFIGDFLYKFFFIALLSYSSLLSSSIDADATDKLFELSLDELMEVSIISASKKKRIYFKVSI